MCIHVKKRFKLEFPVKLKLIGCSSIQCEKQTPVQSEKNLGLLHIIAHFSVTGTRLIFHAEQVIQVRGKKS